MPGGPARDSLIDTLVQPGWFEKGAGLTGRITIVFQLSLWTWATVLLCAISPATFGQIDPLPDPCKVSALTSDETHQIEAFVSNRLMLLGGEDADSRERARRELLAPLRRPCVSVTFRLGYRQASQKTLASLTESTDDEVVINALMVLGELADGTSVQTIEGFTNDPRLAVRYAAVGAMTRSFAAVSARAPALTNGQASAMVLHLATALAKEPQSQVIDAIVRSLLEAASINRDGFKSTRDDALAAVSAHVGERLRAGDDTDRPVLMLTGLRAIEYFSRLLSASGSVSPATARDGSALAGEILAYLAARANAGQIAPDNRQLETDLVNLSQRVLLLANTKLGGSTMPADLKDLFASGDDKAFFARVRTVTLGLDGPPTNLDSAAMDRIRKALEGK